MAWRGALGKGELSFFVEFVRRSGWTGQGVAIVEPLREIAVAATGRTEGRILLDTRLLADRAGLRFGPVVHSATACAKPASSASAGSMATRISRPVRRASSASHASPSLAFTAE